MKEIAYEVLAAIALAILSFGIGWHAKSVSVDASAMHAAQAETKAVVADVTKQGEAQHAAAVAEQGHTIALGIEKVAIRSGADTIQSEINRAQFTVSAPVIALGPTTIASACPDDPVGSDEFVRLYNAAAKGADSTAAAAAAAR